MKEIKEITEAPSLCLENPELFNATRVTITPLESIESSLLDAINVVQKSKNIDLSDHVDKIFTGFNDNLDSQLYQTLARNLPHFVDNLISNYDYCEFVEEFVDDLKDLAAW